MDDAAVCGDVRRRVIPNFWAPFDGLLTMLHAAADGHARRATWHATVITAITTGRLLQVLSTWLRADGNIAAATPPWRRNII